MRQALFLKSNKKFLGTIGDLGCFSLTANKTITTEGGIIVQTIQNFIEKLNF